MSKNGRGVRKNLIPDFIPILGYLDDLVITPLGIALALRMIPTKVMADARHQADALMQEGKPISRLGAILILVFWIMICGANVWSVARALGD